MASQTVGPFVVPAQDSAKSTPARKTKKNKPAPTQAEQTQAELRAMRRKGEIDLTDILTPGDEGRRDVEVAIRCISYLMEFGSIWGEEALDGTIIHGLGLMLRFCAGKVNKLYERDELQFEIEHCGGDWWKSPALARLRPSARKEK
jgi:hypothetical protein